MGAAPLKIVEQSAGKPVRKHSAPIPLSPAQRGRLGGLAKSPAKLRALAQARAARAIAAQRRCPDGYRSVDHFLACAREAVGRRAGGTMELARYLGVGDASLRRWLKGHKLPLQPTIDAIAGWLLNHR